MDNARFKQHYGVLSDTSNLTRIVQETQPDEIYNHGAQSHVAVSFESPEYTADVDGMGTLRILKAIRILGLERKLASTKPAPPSCMAWCRTPPQRETNPFYPRSPYAVATMYAYWITVNYRKAYGMYACNGILFNHESPRQGETFVTHKITRDLANISQGLEDCLYMGNIDALGLNEVACLFAKDDETHSYNHRINRLSTIQEHYMIRRAIDRGVSKERLARAFNVNLSSINRRVNLLSGICPEAIALLQDHQFAPDVMRILRNMKAARQVEAVELMIASNTITVAHVDALLKATPPEQRADLPPPERESKTAPMAQLVKLEKEMSQVEATYKDAEIHYGSDLLNLVVAKGYLTKLLANSAVKSYIERREPEILIHLELVANTVSMEEAVQQQQGEANDSVIAGIESQSMNPASLENIGVTIV